MTKIYQLLWTVLFSLFVTNTHADVFQCKDSAGHIVTSDRPIPECMDKSTQVYGNNGVLKNRLSGALTPEQRQAAELLERQHVKEALRQEEEKKEQRYLLTHYPAEQDIEIARKRELDAIEAKISTEKRLVEVTLEALNKNQDEQTRIPKNQKDKLAEAQSAEDGLVQTIQQSYQLIQRNDLEKANVNRRFDEIHKRYLEIVVSRNK